MNKRIIIIFFFFIGLPINNLFCQNEDESKAATKRGYAHRKKKIVFDFKDKPLVDIVNELADEKKINIIVPQLSGQEIKTKITYHLPEPITLDQAWKQLITMLDFAGYTIEPEGDVQIIRKIDPNINRQILSVYIAEPLENIPDNENIIRTIFYLANINLKTGWGDLSTILKDMLSTTADIRNDPKVNALILTDKATNIKSVMRIIFELDKGGMRDSIEIIPLYYTSASLIENLFTKQLLTQPQQPGAGAGNGAPTPEQAAYFPKNTKIIGIPRNNTLVIMGTHYGIDLVKDFIIKYIDRPLESGESILHIYDLQYLEAQTFASILQNILTPAAGSDQATGQILSGPKQYFKDVIVVAETTKKVDPLTPTSVAGEATTAATTEGSVIGGNRLIIAARKKDWVRIKQLIEQLDKPQPQVALEVIVADVTLNSNKLLASQMRNKKGWNESISDRVDFQSAQISTPILLPANTDLNPPQFPANALMANLLQLGGPFQANQNIASSSPEGSLVFSLADKTNGVWSFWQVLNSYLNTTLIAQPFVVTQNHQQATVTISQQRFLAGTSDTSNVAVNVPNEWVTAAFTIDILPHISLTGNINLQITVKINEFAAAADTGNNTRFTRVVQTNSNVGNREILALGGLTRETVNTQISEIPPFSRIPIVGWFFKKEQKIKERNNLLILISPTIIEPRLGGGIDPFTDQKLAFGKEQLDEGLCYENLRDPVTRWFFRPDPFYAEDVINDYTKRTLHEIHDEHGSRFIENDQTSDDGSKIIAQQTVTTQHLGQELKKLAQSEENPLTAENKSDENQTLPLEPKKSNNRSTLAKLDTPIQTKKKNLQTIVEKDQLIDLIKNEENPLLASNKSEKVTHPSTKEPAHLQ